MKAMSVKRIQLIIRDAGICSRRAAEELISEGRVILNGMVVEDLGQKADPYKDHIKVDGKLIPRTDPVKVYYVLNKPRNVVSTFKDPEGRPTLADYSKSIKTNVFAVGRLDFDAEGLMILTNDGDLAQHLSHPSKSVSRTYMVKVKGVPDRAALSKITAGLNIGGGDRIGRVHCTVTKTQKTSAWLKIVLYEGKKNEIKRMMLRVKHPVRKLRRVAFGPFSLGKLPVGAVRPFTDAEISKVESLYVKESAPKKA